MRSVRSAGLDEGHNGTVNNVGKVRSIEENIELNVEKKRIKCGKQELANFSQTTRVLEVLFDVMSITGFRNGVEKTFRA